MMLQPIAGFKSFTTHHCVTGSMRHVYEFHEYPISEELLLGLGAGVGFVYWHMKGTCKSQHYYGENPTNILVSKCLWSCLPTRIIVVKAPV